MVAPLIRLVAVSLVAFSHTHTLPAYTNHDVQCLAQNIAYEAPDEPYVGKVAVATVTMNRVKAQGFPKTVCGVVFQRSRKGCQFSWVCEKPRALDAVVYAKAVNIARQVLYHNLRAQIVGRALYYHSDSVSPSWSRDPDMKRVAKIGAHIFYVQVYT